MQKGRGSLLITSFICTITVGEASSKVQETRTDGPAASLPQTTTTIGEILLQCHVQYYAFNILGGGCACLYIHVDKAAP